MKDRKTLCFGVAELKRRLRLALGEDREYREAYAEHALVPHPQIMADKLVEFLLSGKTQNSIGERVA